MRGTFIEVYGNSIGTCRTCILGFRDEGVGLPKLGVPFWGVPRKRRLWYLWPVFLGSPYLGIYHITCIQALEAHWGVLLKRGTGKRPSDVNR